MEQKYSVYKEALEKQRCEAQHGPKTLFDDNVFFSATHFGSLDFLGLSTHPYIKKNIMKYALEWGVGRTPNRLTSEPLECHHAVEEKLATRIGKETALLFPSIANLHRMTLHALAKEGATFFTDSQCQKELMGAAKNSGASLTFYDKEHLDGLKKELIEQSDAPSRIIIAESLSPFDGEVSHLKELSEIAKEQDALLYVDDSFGVEVLGKNGMGLSAHRSGIDFVIGAFGSPSGSFGAYIGLKQVMRDYLVACHPSIKEATLLSPPTLGAVSAALDLIPDMQLERRKIMTLSACLQKELKSEGWVIGEPEAHVIPLIFSSKPECESVIQRLAQKKVLTTQFPTAVESKEARLHLVVNAHLQDSDIETLLEELKKHHTKAPTSVSHF